ncbi:hypothetical protein JW933_09415, partial [candidate division FCPU426 bacterium]|nr:hypothetical protein [candidate division FCPU426 bacterium]
MFRGLAFGAPALMGNLSLKALFSLGWQQVSAMLGWSIVVFAGAHIIVRWIKRAKEAIGWKALLPWKFLHQKYMQRQDLKDFFKYLIPAILFTGIYLGAAALSGFLMPDASQLTLQGIALLSSFLGHEAWNYAVKQGWLKGMLVASMEASSEAMPSPGSKATAAKKNQLFAWIETVFSDFSADIKHLSNPLAGQALKEHIQIMIRMAGKMGAGEEQNNFISLQHELETALLAVHTAVQNAGLAGEEETAADQRDLAQTLQELGIGQSTPQNQELQEAETQLQAVVDRLNREFFIPNSFLLRQQYSAEQGMELAVFHIDEVHWREQQITEQAGEVKTQSLPVYIVTPVNDQPETDFPPVSAGPGYAIMEYDYMEALLAAFEELPGEAMSPNNMDEEEFQDKLEGLANAAASGKTVVKNPALVRAYGEEAADLFPELMKKIRATLAQDLRQLSSADRKSILVDLALAGTISTGTLHGLDSLLARAVAAYQDAAGPQSEKIKNLTKARYFLAVFAENVLLGLPWLPAGQTKAYVRIILSWLETARLPVLQEKIKQVNMDAVQEPAQAQEIARILAETFQGLASFLTADKAGAIAVTGAKAVMAPVARNKDGRKHDAAKRQAAKLFKDIDGRVNAERSAAKTDADARENLQQAYAEGMAYIIRRFSGPAAIKLTMMEALVSLIVVEQKGVFRGVWPVALQTIDRIMDQAGHEEQALLSVYVQAMLQDVLDEINDQGLADQTANFIVEQYQRYGGLWELTRKPIVNWLAQKRGFTQRTAERIYDFGLAFIVENKLSLAVGGVVMGAVGLGAALWTGSFDFLLANGIQWGWILSWGAVFLPMHFITRQGWRTPSKGVWIPAVIITIINILLVFTPLPWWGLMLAGMGVHAAVNVAASLRKKRAPAEEAVPAARLVPGRSGSTVAQRLPNVFLLKKIPWFFKLWLGVRRGWLLILSAGCMAASIGQARARSVDPNALHSLQTIRDQRVPQIAADIVRGSAVTFAALTIPRAGIWAWCKGQCLGHCQDTNTEQGLIYFIPRRLLKILAKGEQDQAF